MAGQDHLIETALSMGRQLCREAIWNGESCTWMGTRIGAAGQDEAYILGPSLYAGTAGVGYFLAELHSVCPESIFARTARGAFARSLDKLSRRPGETGFFNGTAGIVLTAAIVRQDLGLNMNLATETATLIASTARQNSPDLIAGLAGTLLVLSYLSGRADFSHDPACLDPLAAKLRATARISGHGASWQLPSGDHLSGLAHGSSGIATALLAFDARRGSRNCEDLVEQAFAFEDAHFDRSAGNWQDLRSTQPSAKGHGSMVAWCHGAGGILVARLQAQRAGAPIRKDVEVAVAATTRAADLIMRAPIRDDGLCHGLSGLAAILFLASKSLGKYEFYEQANRIMRVQCDKRSAVGRLSFQASSGDETPQFMPGLSGVGHLLLQASGRSRLPFLLDPKFQPLGLTSAHDLGQTF